MSVFNSSSSSRTSYLLAFFSLSLSLGVHLLLFPKLLWWWQWWDYEVSVFSFSTASPHGLLPPLSFYSLLLGDASLSPNVTQAKTPLSSFARAYYPGNTAIPPLLFYTHLLSSLILPTSSPPSSPPPIPLQPVLDTEFVFGTRVWRWDVSHALLWVSTMTSSTRMCSWVIIVTCHIRFYRSYFAVERMLIFTLYHNSSEIWLPNVVWCAY